MDCVYNLGYATPAGMASVAGCTEAAAYAVLSTAASPKEYHLLIMLLEQESNGMVMRLSTHPSLGESGISGRSTPRALAAVSHSFIALYNGDASSMWSAIVTKECEAMMTDPIYGMLYARITIDEIRQAMEARNKRLQVTDNDLVRYSRELFYAVVGSDARYKVHTNHPPPSSHSSTDPIIIMDEPSIKKTALQGVSSTIVSSLAIAEDGSLETVRKEIAALPANKPKTKSKQKSAACDIMSFVKKRDSS